MALEFKTIQPLEYFRRFLKLDRRPDQRGLWEAREMKIVTGSISTADSSAIVKLGNTCVVCGIKGELVAPKSDEPKKGYIVPNVEFSSICSPSFRPGPPNEKSQVTSQVVNNLIEDSQCINLEDLCILNGKLVWVLYCDILCLDYDGNAVDAAVLSLFCALKHLTLPSVSIKPDESVTINRFKRENIPLLNFPVTTTFTMIDNYIIMDPTNEEENLSQGFLTIAVLQDKFCLFKKTGGGLLDSNKRDNCLKYARDHATHVHRIVDECMKN